MTTQQVIDSLNALVRKHGSQTAVAEQLGVSLQYLNDVLNGRRDPGPKVLKALGLRKGYERV